MCTIPKDFGINEEEETCLSKKESVSVHRCERTNMDAKCKMFMNCSKNLIGICKKINMTSKHGILKGL